jgi:hypothetical protein
MYQWSLPFYVAIDKSMGSKVSRYGLMFFCFFVVNSRDGGSFCAACGSVDHGINTGSCLVHDFVLVSNDEVGSSVYMDLVFILISRIDSLMVLVDCEIFVGE